MTGARQRTRSSPAAEAPAGQPLEPVRLDRPQRARAVDAGCCAAQARNPAVNA